MNTKKETFQEQVNKFEDLLQEFENEIDHQLKGLQLSGLHKHFSTIQSVIKEESDFTIHRQMQSLIKPKELKFKQLEEQFLMEIEMIFYENQVKDFAQLVLPLYSTKGKEEMNVYIERFFNIQNSFDKLKNMKISNKTIQSYQMKILKLQKSEIQRFKSAFSSDLLAFNEQKNNKKKEGDQKIASNSSFDSNKIVIDNTPTKEQNWSNKQNKNKLKGSILEDFHPTAEHAEEDMEKLQRMKQQLQYELDQKQQLQREEQEQIEIQQEIFEVCKEIQMIDSMMNDMALLIEQQGEHIDIIETTTESTHQAIVDAEKELQQASREQIKYRTKLASAQGAAVGGGVGLLMGGPVGTAVGALIGGVIGKAVGSIGSKKSQ